MACVTGEGSNRYPKENEYMDTLEFFLCRCCRMLTKEQMQLIVRRDQSEFCNKPNQLIKWYEQHLKEDYVFEDGHEHRPDKSTALDELRRLSEEVCPKRIYPY